MQNQYGALGIGHYIAYAKNVHTGRWYLFNDSRVKEVVVTEIDSGGAYVMFYERRRRSSTADNRQCDDKQ